MTMTFYDRDDVIVEAASNDEFAELKRVKLAGSATLDAEFRVIDDLMQETLLILEPADLQVRLVAAGYRSWLSVHTSVRDQKMGLSFWSKRPAAFSTQDFPVARRVADHVALAVSHEQLALAAQQVAEARARRASGVARQTAADELDSAGYGRVVGYRPWKDHTAKAAGCRDRHDRAPDGRIGHGQGSRGAVHSPRVVAAERTVCRPQLRRAARAAPRVRAVRL
jgi:hypothetical protein